jgi:hypothetical protein
MHFDLVLPEVPPEPDEVEEGEVHDVLLFRILRAARKGPR